MMSISPAKKNDYFADIDVLKGVGIFLVVLGHTSIGGLSSKIIFSFHMPLFFFISGFLYKKSLIKNVVKKKFERILIPYFFFSLITFLLYYIPTIFFHKNHLISWKEFFIGTLFGLSEPPYLTWDVVLWFLPALFFTFIIVEILMSINNKYLLCFLVAVLSFAGIWFGKYKQFMLPYSIDAVLSVLPIFFTGYLLKINVKKVNLLSESKIVNISLITVLIMLGYISALYNPGKVDLRINLINNPILFYLAAICFSLGLYLLLKSLPKPGMIIWLGVNSLLIMCLHLKFRFLSGMVLHALHINSIFGYILMASIDILMLFPVILFINKYFPALAGNKLS